MQLILDALTLSDWQLKAAKKWAEERRRRQIAIEEEIQSVNDALKTKLLFLLFLVVNERKKWKDYLTMEGIWRRDHRIPRIALVSPSKSPWSQLYSSLNDQTLITMTGYDHAAFESLLYLFEPHFNNFTPWVGRKDGSTFAVHKKKKGGRRRLVNAKSCLGLTLAWYMLKGSEFIVCGWFGFTGICANAWLCFGCHMLMLALWKNPLAKVRLPSDDKIKVMMETVGQKHNALHDVQYSVCQMV